MGTEGHRRSASRIVGRGVYLWQYAFQSLAKFRCGKVDGPQGRQGQPLLFWKTEDEKEHVPKFEDKGIRAEVLRAWKLIHARDIALKAAETLAAEARKADKPLKQVFADRPERHVILPSKFTWLNFPNVAHGWQQPARLSAVEGVDMPGWDFMREVFGLQQGQVGVAFNAPKTIAYVVRPSQFTPSYDVLRPQFETEPLPSTPPPARRTAWRSTGRGSTKSRNPPASPGDPATGPSAGRLRPGRARNNVRASTHPTRRNASAPVDVDRPRLGIDQVDDPVFERQADRIETPQVAHQPFPRERVGGYVVLQNLAELPPQPGRQFLHVLGRFAGEPDRERPHASSPSTSSRESVSPRFIWATDRFMPARNPGIASNSSDSMRLS